MIVSEMTISEKNINYWLERKRYEWNINVIRMSTGSLIWPETIIQEAGEM